MVDHFLDERDSLCWAEEPLLFNIDADANNQLVGNAAGPLDYVKMTKRDGVERSCVDCEFQDSALKNDGVAAIIANPLLRCPTTPDKLEIALVTPDYPIIILLVVHNIEPVGRWDVLRPTFFVHHALKLLRFTEGQPCKKAFALLHSPSRW